MSESAFDVQVNQFWNELLAGQAPEAGAIDPRLINAIEQFHTFSQAPISDSARERIRRKVLDQSVSTEGETLVTLNAAALPLPNANGTAAPARRLPAPSKVIPTPNTRLHWAMMAAAILLILASIGSWLGYDHFRSNDQAPALVPAVQTTPADWPMYKGSPARTGAADGFGPISSPTELWHFTAGASVGRSPAVVGSIAYVGSADGVLSAIDTTNGQELWQFNGDSSLEGTPTVADGVAYIGSQLGTLYAVDAGTGQQLWSLPTTASQQSSPLVVGDWLFLGSDEGVYSALDAKSGEVRWTFQAGGPISRSSSFADSVVYTGSEDGNLYALDANTGNELWHFATGGEIVGTPVVGDGKIYVALPEGSGLFVIDAATGEQLQQLSGIAGGTVTPIALVDHSIFVGGQETNAFYRVDADTGQTIWKTDVSGTMQAAPAVVGGVMYGGLADGTVVAIDADTGQLLWTFATGSLIDYGPSVASGVVYAGTRDGVVFAIGGDSSPATPSAGAATGATPVASLALTAQLVWSSDPGEFGQAPNSIAFTPDGNLAIVSYLDSQVYVVSPDGQLVETWGEAGTGEGQLQAPVAIAIDGDGTTYIGDRNRHQILKFAPDHTYLSSWGSNGTGEGQFQDITGLAVDADGNVYVSDYPRNTVQKFDSSGTILFTVGTPEAEPVQLNQPAFIGFDKAGNLLVPECSHNNRVTVLSPDGKYLTSFGSSGGGRGQFGCPNSVDVDASDLIYVAEYGNNRVQVFDSAYNSLYAFGEKGIGEGQFVDLVQVLVDDQGNLYAVSPTNGRVQKFVLPDIAAEAATPAP